MQLLNPAWDTCLCRLIYSRNDLCWHWLDYLTNDDTGRRRSGLILDRVLTCLGAKPLPDPKLTHCQFFLFLVAMAGYGNANVHFKHISSRLSPIFSYRKARFACWCQYMRRVYYIACLTVAVSDQASLSLFPLLFYYHSFPPSIGFVVSETDHGLLFSDVRKRDSPMCH